MSQTRLDDDPLDCIRQRGLVGWWDDQSRYAVLDDLRQSANGGRDDRSPGGHRLNRGQRKRLLRRAQHVDVKLFKGPNPPVICVHETDLIGEPQLASETLELESQRAVTDHGERKAQALGGKPRDSTEQKIDPLLGPEPGVRADRRRALPRWGERKQRIGVDAVRDHGDAPGSRKTQPQRLLTLALMGQVELISEVRERPFHEQEQSPDIFRALVDGVREIVRGEDCGDAAGARRNTPQRARLGAVSVQYIRLEAPHDPHETKQLEEVVGGSDLPSHLQNPHAGPRTGKLPRHTRAADDADFMDANLLANQRVDECRSSATGRLNHVKNSHQLGLVSPSSTESD